jgi:hypothetical protein
VPTPFEHLEDHRGAAPALSFVIEGFATTFSTASTADMVGVYTGDSAPYSQFSDPIGGMFARGTLAESIKLYTPDIDPSSIEVSIVDKTGALASLFRENYSSGHRTYLTANLLAGNDHTEGDAAGVISVQSTAVSPGAGFGASGIVYIGGEAITYTGKTATTFTGCARAKYVINQTDVATAFSPSHLIGTDVTASATTAPSVTDYPRTWYGRMCHVFLHIRDQVTGVYTKPSASTKVFTGRIEMYGDDGQGNINIQLKSATDALMRPLGPDQWRAKIATGLIFADTRLAVVRAPDGGATYFVYTKMTGLSATAATSHDELAAEINETFRANTWDSGGTTAAGDQWSLELIEDASGQFRYHMKLDPSTTAATTGAQIRFQLHPHAMRLLGFTPDGGTGWDEDGIATCVRWMHRRSDGTYETVAEKPPIVYFYTRLESNSSLNIAVADEVGTFVEQTGGVDFASSWGGNGVIQVKGGKYDGVYIVEYTNGSPSTVVIKGVLDRATGIFSPYANPEDPEGDGAVRLGDPGDETPEVKQVLLYRGSAGTLLLRCLLSSGGASGYNHTEYDTLTTAGFGLGIPSSLVDVASWEALNDATIEMFVGEPRPFYEMLEPILQMTGSYVVWKAADELSNPKITVVQPSLDTAYLATWQLSESNKCRPDERTRVTRALDGIVSRVVIKAGHGLATPTEASKTYILDNIASQTDYGKRRTMTINAGPVVNYESLMASTLAPALAYFSRPLAVAERSYNASCVRMAPGDSVTLTDSYVIDPATGTRGATIYAWVLDTSFDLATMQGRARVIFLPEKSPNFTAPWAPSARVDETAGGGGYNAGSKILTVKANEFSPAGAAVSDYQRFAAGDKVRVAQIDAAAPLEWFDTVVNLPGTNQIRLSVGLAGFVAGNRYVIEFDDINTVTSTQRDVAYLADATTLSTGYATAPLPFEWGSGGIAVSGATVDHSVGMFRPETRYDDQGEPCSIHKQTHLVYGTNSMLSYRTRSVHLCEYFGNRTQTGTTPRLILMARIPIYGHSGNDGTRSLVARVRGFQTGGGTATFVVASSQVHPSGTSYTDFTFPGGFNTVTATTTSATNAWSSEMTLRPAVVEAGDGNRYTWISLYISGSGGGITATVNEISVAEAAL